MRNNREAAAEALRRARLLVRRRVIRRQFAAVAATGLVCLGLIVAAALGISQSGDALYSNVKAPGVQGATFLQGETLGYVVIGASSFLLGVAAALLAFLIRKRASTEDLHEVP